MLEKIMAGLNASLEPVTELYFEVPALVSRVVEHSQNELATFYGLERKKIPQGVMPDCKKFMIDNTDIRYGIFMPFDRNFDSALLMYTNTLYKHVDRTFMDLGFVAVFTNPDYLVWSYTSTRDVTYSRRGSFACKPAHIRGLYDLSNYFTPASVDLCASHANIHLREAIHSHGDQQISKPAQILPRMILVVMLGNLLARKEE